jgi:hypothetical protein
LPLGFFLGATVLLAPTSAAELPFGRFPLAGSASASGAGADAGAAAGAGLPDAAGFEPDAALDEREGAAAAGGVLPDPCGFAPDDGLEAGDGADAEAGAVLPSVFDEVLEARSGAAAGAGLPDAADELEA